MAFPFTHESVLEFPSKDDIHRVGILLNKIKSSLKKVKGQNIRIHRNQITFNGGIFRAVINLNLLISISSGSIEIENDNDILKIQYCLKFTETLILTTLAVVLIIFPTVLEIASMNIVSKVTSSILIWFFLFGANYFITTLRFRSFLEEIIKAL